jgi:hypothetical protein
VYAACKTVTIRNGTGQSIELHFGILVEPGDADASTAELQVPTVRPATDPVTLGPFEVGQVELVFTGSTAFEGTLVATATAASATTGTSGIVASATMPMEFAPAQKGIVPIPSWASELTWLLLAVCLVIGFAITFGSYYVWGLLLLRRRLRQSKRLEKRLKPEEATNGTDSAATAPIQAMSAEERKATEACLALTKKKVAEGKNWGLKNPMGGVEWEIQKSYGSALGLGASLLAAIIDAGLLPDDAFTDKSPYFGLVLTFGVLILVAPMLYAVFQRKHPAKGPDPTAAPQWPPITTTISLNDVPLPCRLTSTRPDPKAEDEVLGYVWAFLVASAITVGAVIGQVWTVFLLLEGLLKAGAATGAAITALEIATGLTLILLCAYFVRTLGWIIQKQAREKVELIVTQPSDPGVQEAVARTVVQMPRWSPL